MLTIFYSTMPILVALILGYAVGKSRPQSFPVIAGKLIGPLVWLLLLSIGVEFAEVFKDPATAGRSIYLAAVFSLLTTFGSCLLIYIFFYKSNGQSQSISSTQGKSNFIEPVKECLIAFSMVFIGVLLSSLPFSTGDVLAHLPITDSLLYTLVFFVGIDIVNVQLTTVWRSAKVIIIPVLVIIGSLIGGAAASYISQENLNTSLALSSGFGWFSLSGVLVSSKLGAVYGTVALLTDLFRELLAILLLYLFGHKYARECIGAGGATSLDTTLPIIKQRCESDLIPIALVSGFILTLIAPVLMTFLLSAA
ncbi:lysine exporter LysO family protein [Psychromonas ossibalaenae]|uniref:lysine exporter LysO family protein n=1 Tax=Psychromonas ossibalaenae TaxID=444922 RepID=UPI000367CBBB|nr:lysine exporter LysO family protein [Psychromonas ossibalaenae]